MRTIIALCAAALVMVGCADSYGMNELANKYEAVTDTLAVSDTISTNESNICCTFNVDEQTDSVLIALYDEALKLYESHKNFCGFEELLPDDLLERLNEQCYPELEDLLMAIHLWWMDDAAGEVIDEYSGNDLFFELVAQTKWSYLFGDV